MTTKYHIEANGKKTLICELENSHLINILKLFSVKLRQAKEVLENGKTMKFKNAFYGKVLNVEDAESFVGNFELGSFFEKVIIDFSLNKDLIKLASNYISSDMVGILSKDPNLKYPDDKSFAKIIESA